MDDIRNGHNGNGHNGNGQEGPRSLNAKLRDLVAVGFRRRVLMRRAFLVSLLGCLIAVVVFGVQYQSEVEIMVKRDTRVEPAATPDTSPRPVAAARMPGPLYLRETRARKGPRCAAAMSAAAPRRHLEAPPTRGGRRELRGRT